MFRALALFALVVACEQTSGSEHAPARDCERSECVRLVMCVEHCGGPLVTASCCPCEEGLLDSDMECPAGEGPAPAR